MSAPLLAPANSPFSIFRFSSFSDKRLVCLHSTLALFTAYILLFCFMQLASASVIASYGIPIQFSGMHYKIMAPIRMSFGQIAALSIAFPLSMLVLSFFFRAMLRAKVVRTGFGYLLLAWLFILSTLLFLGSIISGLFSFQDFGYAVKYLRYNRLLMMAPATILLIILFFQGRAMSKVMLYAVVDKRMLEAEELPNTAKLIILYPILICSFLIPISFWPIPFSAIISWICLTVAFIGLYRSAVTTDKQPKFYKQSQYSLSWRGVIVTIGLVAMVWALRLLHLTL